MRVLGIESSSTTASMAIIEDYNLIGEYTINNTMKHSKTLMPMLEDLMNRLDLDVSDLDLISVSEGPGSFTGLRIGSATAKGLAHGLGLKVASIPTLEVIASTVKVPGARVGVVVFARAREVYYAEYLIDFVDGQFLPREVSAIRALEVEDLIEDLKNKRKHKADSKEMTNISNVTRVEDNAYLIGDGIWKFEKEFLELSNQYKIPKPIYCSFSAKNVALLGLSRYYSGDVMTYFQQKPYYHKKSQAEREYEEKHKND